MTATFMAAVEATIVATAMPSIVADLGGFRLFTWVFAVYLLTQAVTIPIYGKLADLYGRKRVFFAGASLFLLGSALCGFAWGMVPLIAFRALQGLGAGAILPIATTIVGDLYEPATRGRVQGYLSSVWGVSAVIGPVLGAFLVQHLNWALVFWINLPIGGIAIALLARFLREPPARRAHRVDYAGAILLMLGAGALMLALVQAESLGAPVATTLCILALVALGALWVRERRAAEPILPLRLWRNRTIVVSNLGSLASGSVMMGVTAFLPIYVQGVMGKSPTVAGFVLTVMSLGWSAGSIAIGRLIGRVSHRWTAAAGGFALLVGTLLLIGLEPARGPLWAGTGAFVIGIGMGFTSTTFLVAIQSSVGREERGTATSSMLFLRMLGQSLGAALFGAIVNLGVDRGLPGGRHAVDRLMESAQRAAMPPDEIGRLTGAIAGSLHEVYLIAGLIAAVTLVLTLALPSGSAHADEPAENAPAGRTAAGRREYREAGRSSL
ncbi:MAG: MDR family MFS transporter [Geminicoccaceae bacterium]